MFKYTLEESNDKRKTYTELSILSKRERDDETG